MESVCVCGRSFLQLSAFTNHKRTCHLSKKRLSGALEKAKQLWRGTKRRRLLSSTVEVDEVPLAGLTPAVAMEVRSLDNNDDDSNGLLTIVPRSLLFRTFQQMNMKLMTPTCL